MPVSDLTARRFVFNVLQFGTDVQISRTVIDHIEHMLKDQEEDLPFFLPIIHLTNCCISVLIRRRVEDVGVEKFKRIRVD
jgi:hypothetical protein